MECFDLRELKLENGKDYFLGFLSIDIAKSSSIVRNYDSDKVHDAFIGFKDFVSQKVNKFGGFIEEWEGDGGTIVFKDEMFFAVMCGIEVILYLILYNVLVNDLDDNINIRIAIHADNINYDEKLNLLRNKNKILADDIQKQATKTNCFVITENVYKFLPEKIKAVFEEFFFPPLNMKLYEFRKFNIF